MRSWTTACKTTAGRRAALARAAGYCRRSRGGSMPEPQHQGAYIYAGGRQCAVCLGTDLAHGRYDSEHPDTVTRRWGCSTCGASWVAVYELAGYEGLRTREHPMPETWQLVSSVCTAHGGHLFYHSEGWPHRPRPSPRPVGERTARAILSGALPDNAADYATAEEARAALATPGKPGRRKRRRA